MGYTQLDMPLSSNLKWMQISIATKPMSQVLLCMRLGTFITMQLTLYIYFTLKALLWCQLINLN